MYSKKDFLLEEFNELGNFSLRGFGRLQKARESFGAYDNHRPRVSFKRLQEETVRESIKILQYILFFH